MTSLMTSLHPSCMINWNMDCSACHVQGTHTILIDYVSVFTYQKEIVKMVFLALAAGLHIAKQLYIDDCKEHQKDHCEQDDNQ